MNTKLKQFTFAALLLASAGIAQAGSFTCYWVGQVYQTPLVDGMGGDPAFHTWGDSAGWSLVQGTAGGSCPGGAPQNGSITYNAVIANANATAFLNNVGQTSLVQVVTNGQPISPTISSLNITSSTLDFDASTLTTGTLIADGSHINGGNVAVSAAGGVNTLNNMFIDSTAFDFSGDSSSSSFTGTLQLARIAAGSGKDGTGTVHYGVAPILASSGNAALIFNNVILYGQDPSTASLGLIQSNGTTPGAFTGTNNILGTVLQGQFVTNSGSTTFVQANNQGILTAQSGGSIYFNNGMMTQQAGNGPPGFTQSGTGMFFANDLTATSGSFNGLIHLNGDGLGGGAYDNTLTGVTLNTGGTLSIETGTTSFTGANLGTLVTNGGSLTLAGSVDNTNGSIQNLSGSLTLLNASVMSGNISGDLSSNGVSSLNGLSYSNGNLKVASGNLTLNSVNMTNAIIGSDVQFTGTNSLSGTTLRGNTTIAGGITTFQGVNQGTLGSAQAAGTLDLTGSVDNTNGEILSQVGGLGLQDATVGNGRITGDAVSNGNSQLNGLTYRSGTLSVGSGNLTLQNVTNSGTITTAGGTLTLTGHIDGGTFEEKTVLVSLEAPPVTGLIQLNGASVINAALSGDLLAAGSNSLHNDTFGAGSLSITAGNTALSGGVVFNQNYSFNATGGGVLNNNQVLSNAAGSTLTFSGSIANASGNILQQGTSGIAFNNASVNGGSIGNGGAFDGANSLTALTLGGVSNINSGTTTGAGIVNQGIVNANGGTFVLTGATQTGTINGSTPQSVQVNGASLTGGQITGGLIANGANTFSGVHLTGALEVDSGNTNGAGLTFTGANPAYLVRGGTLALSASTSVPITVSSGGELDLSGTPTITGVTSAGNITAVSGTAILNSLTTTGGTLQAGHGATLGLNNATIMNTALVAQPQQVASCGTFCVTFLPAGTLQATGLNTIFNASLSGAGLTVTGGTTSLLGNIEMASASKFTAANSGTLDLSGATIMGGGFATTGTGVVQVFGQNYLFGSGAQGNFNSSFNGALTVAGSDWVLNPGAATLIGQSGTLDLTTGAVRNEGGLIDVEIGGVLAVPTLFVQDSGSTTVHGTLHSGSSAAPGDIDINGGTFVYDSTIDLFGNLNFSNSAAGLVINNSDIFGSVSLGANSMIEGSHAISGDLVNGGTVQSDDAAGAISIGGNYSQQAGGTLTIQLGGDQLMIAGTANLNGTLNLTSWNGLQPVAGESFRILTFASEIGTFSGVDLTGITDTNYQILYDAQDVTVAFGQSPAAPEPSTWVLIAGGLVMLTLSARRRRNDRAI